MSITRRLSVNGAVFATAALGLSLLAFGVHAQGTQPATKAPPAGNAPAAAATTKAPVAKKSAAPSPCKGLEKAACEAKAECSYVAATVRKDGKAVKAYCKSKPATVAKLAPTTPKAPAPTAAPAAKSTAPATSTTAPKKQ